MERPASVIKELIENSLDAGATQIEVEIDKGGHKRILVRDNGSGIDKEQLTLALSRHATSKIAALDDLEHIMSLGFRGEALASISSVARLTLTSRTAEQSEAWQAHAEGRDMQVEINPAAHPKGTSVEVLDLFFNTPARRKFLRTEKTEFGHIEEVIKRIALSRFDVAFSLKHNGKLIKKFPLAANDNSKFKRVSSVCGNEFSQHAIQVTSSYQQLKLSGWLAGPRGARNQNDVQYFYVNGRMMRDKLINHAIRQAFEGLLPAECYPAFTLYLEIPPEQVDVNVHPAKHEVRFHQSRLVHDFIYRAITDVLEQPYDQLPEEQTGTNQPQGVELVRELEEVAPKHDYIAPLQSGFEPAPGPPRGGLTSRSGSSGSSYSSSTVSAEAASNYQILMEPKSDSQTGLPIDWLNIDGKILLIKLQSGFYALPVAQMYHRKLVADFEESQPVGQPLLMPVSLEANAGHIAAAQKLYEPLLQLSIEIGWSAKRILLRKVPAGYRQLPWTNILPELLQIPLSEEGLLLSEVCKAMAKNTDHFDDNVAKRLLNWMYNKWPEHWQDKVKAWGKALPLETWIRDHAAH